MAEHIERAFPRLASDDYGETSPKISSIRASAVSKATSTVAVRESLGGA
jgi:hypothetical protein